jgi:hypothetical protein
MVVVEVVVVLEAVNTDLTVPIVLVELTGLP